MNIADYKIKDFKVFKNNDAFLNYKESQAKTLITLNQENENISLNLKQILLPSISSFEAKDKVIKTILKEVSTLSPLELELSATGDISNPKIKVSTNIADKIISSIKKVGKNLLDTKVNEEINKVKNDFLAEYLPNVDKNSKDLNSQSLSLDSQISSLFDEEINKLKNKVKTSKSDKVDKLKDKLLDKLKF